jgi:DNA-directed RNA polymerase subunit RPC12/RpoP
MRRFRCKACGRETTRDPLAPFGIRCPICGGYMMRMGIGGHPYHAKDIHTGETLVLSKAK